MPGPVATHHPKNPLPGTAKAAVPVDTAAFGPSGVVGPAEAGTASLIAIAGSFVTGRGMAYGRAGHRLPSSRSWSGPWGMRW